MSKDTRKPPKREAILVVMHVDGYIEVFGEKTADVRIVRCPQTFSNAAAITAEDYLRETLPWRWRQLFWPGKRRASTAIVSRVHAPSKSPA